MTTSIAARYPHSAVQLLLAALVGVVLVHTPGVAQAQDYTEEQLDTFKKNLAEGTKAYNNERFEKALEKYLAARSAIDEPRLTYRIALTYDKLDRCRDAKSEYRNFLEETEGSGNLEKQRQTARATLKSLKQRCPPTGKLTIQCDPRDASVTVDGEEKSCPTTLSLEAGDYQVEANAEGYQTATSTVTVVGGESTTTKLVMRPGVEESDSGTRGAWRDYGPWIGIGTGALLIGGGLLTDASAVSRADELRQAREAGDTERIQTLRDEAQAARTRTWIFYGSGLALAAGSAVWYVIDRPAPETNTRSASVQPTISPNSVGLHIRW